jgi:hypothetical protein
MLRRSFEAASKLFRRVFEEMQVFLPLILQSLRLPHHTLDVSRLSFNTEHPLGILVEHLALDVLARREAADRPLPWASLFRVLLSGAPDGWAGPLQGVFPFPLD